MNVSENVSLLLFCLVTFACWRINSQKLAWGLSRFDVLGRTPWQSHFWDLFWSLQKESVSWGSLLHSFFLSITVVVLFASFCNILLRFSVLQNLTICKFFVAANWNTSKLFCVAAFAFRFLPISLTSPRQKASNGNVSNLLKGTV